MRACVIKTHSNQFKTIGDGKFAARWTSRVYTLEGVYILHASHDTHQKTRGGRRSNDEHLLKIKQVQKGTSVAYHAATFKITTHGPVTTVVIFLFEYKVQNTKVLILTFYIKSLSVHTIMNIITKQKL